ncbi:MAG: hypothetical protein IKT38_02260 [Clostridia bacterium]|nr:hypothetical protein [Clostridia bacterium]
MAINSIENAVRYSDELDKMFEQKSAVGFFADNAMATKFVGAKTVIIPDIDFQGLADYDREAGFARGAITVSNGSYTMQMDRARSLQIDREDMSETGIANLAGKILGEYVRTKVVPECDAYVLSKLAGLAISRANTIDGDIKAPFEALCNLIGEVQAGVGYDEEIVAFVDSHIYASLLNSSEISKMITVSDFKQGNIDMKVKSINGVAIIPVVSERMKTAYDFGSSGFKPADITRETYMLVCPKSAAHLVKKTEQMRIFTPEQNIDADAYKFDYRIYYDVFVKNSGLDSIWAWVSPEVEIEAVDTEITTYEGTSATLAVTATSEGELTYQWYKCDNENKRGAVKIAGANDESFTTDDELEAGVYYYFVRVTVDSVASTDSDVYTVTVE